MAGLKCPLDYVTHLKPKNLRSLRYKLSQVEKIESQPHSSAQDVTQMTSLLKEIRQILARHFPQMTLQFLKQIEQHVTPASNCPHPPLKELTLFTVPGRLKGTRPLLLACLQGELDSVEYIVEPWGSDVNVNDSITSISRFQIDFKGATPLFVAAYNGHDQIVRFLLEKGADVSAKSTIIKSNCESDTLAPLYGAVCELLNPEKLSLTELRVKRNAIVRSLLEFGADPSTDCLSSRYNPMWMHSKVCGVDTTTALVNHGLDLKWRDPQFGETILHYWASCPPDFNEEDSLAIVKLLVKKGGDIRALNNCGYTPLLLTTYHLNLKVLDYLLERKEFDVKEKTDAMELAGSTILFLGEDGSRFFSQAFDYLRRALLLLHQMETEDESSSSTKIWKWSIGGTEEWTTLADFDEIIQHPIKYKIRSHLFRLRIVYGISWKAFVLLLKQYKTRLNMMRLPIEENFVEQLHIIWAILDTIRRFDRRNRRLWRWTMYVFQCLVGTFSGILKYQPQLLNADTIKTSLDLVLETDQFHLDDRDRDFKWESEFTENLKRLITMIESFPQVLDEHNSKCLNSLMAPRERNRKGLLLLAACKNEGDENYLVNVRTHLEAGADPNVGLDRVGNSPLHVAAGLNDLKLSEATATLLLEKGTHLDRVNKAGYSAADVWMETRNRNGAATGWSARPDWCRNVPNLLCLAARIIRVHKIPYSGGKTPAILHSFVRMH